MPVTQYNIKKGDRVKSLNFGWTEAVSDPYPSGLSKGDFKVDVRFDDTGTTRRGVLDRYFLGGYVRDGSVLGGKEVGTVYNTFECGQVEIVEFKRTKEVKVKFLNTGNIQKVQFDPLVTGLVNDHLLSEWNQFLERERVHLNSVRASFAKARKDKIEKDRALVRERLLQEKEGRRQELLKLTAERDGMAAARKEQKLANIYNILKIVPKELNQEKSVKGVINVDFKDRDGKWVLRFQMGGQFFQTRLGKLHNNLTQRVRKGNSQYYKSYSGVEISETFKDPQKFCNWCVTQSGWGMGYHLEKDLLSGDSKIYSEDTCVFLPREINLALIPLRKSRVHYTKEDKYCLHISWCGEESIIVGFETEDEALIAYKQYREAYVKKLAHEYKEAISEKAFDTLLSWEATLQD